MIPLDDPGWHELEGGYRIPFDASAPLRRLETGGDAWDDLWENLHHQGDVGAASYAAVPHLARIAGTLASRNWQFFSLVATIEIERHRRANPPLPDWLAADYSDALRALVRLALDDLRDAEAPDQVRILLGFVALVKGEFKVGVLLSHCDGSEMEEFFETANIPIAFESYRD